MAFFHHQTIRKYTLALLSTFNNLEVEKLKSDGITKTYSTVPLRFSSREKSTIFSEVETSQITNGNFNVIPRASLVFNGMTRNSERQTSKFNKINRTITQVNDSQTLSFQYNAIPYDFSYSLVIMADGMNEASMIVEQIASFFNPVYNLFINEIPLQTEPTTIPLSLESITIENQEYDEFSSSITTIECELLLKGNIYPPIADVGVINQVQIFNNKWDGSEFERISKITWEKQMDETFGASLISFANSIRKIKPIVLSIAGPSSITIATSYNYIADFNDPDNKFSELTFNWEIIPPVGISPDTIGTTIGNTNVCEVTTTDYTGSFDLQCTITDIHGNVSDSLSIPITVAV